MFEKVSSGGWKWAEEGGKKVVRKQCRGRGLEGYSYIVALTAPARSFRKF